jgi:hypothetical protein
MQHVSREPASRDDITLLREELDGSLFTQQASGAARESGGPDAHTDHYSS